MQLNQISEQIIGSAIEVHRTLGGPGLLEVMYERALAWELTQRGLLVQTQIEVPVHYKGISLGEPLRLDMLVNKAIIVECKAVITYNKVFEAQALTYLRLTGLRLALVINFGEEVVRKGVHRVVNRL